MAVCARNLAFVESAPTGSTASPDQCAVVESLAMLEFGCIESMADYSNDITGCRWSCSITPIHIPTSLYPLAFQRRAFSHVNLKTIGIDGQVLMCVTASRFLISSSVDRYVIKYLVHLLVLIYVFVCFVSQ